MADPAPTSERFSAAVALTATAPEHLDLAFLGATQDCPWPKAYGGDLVAQAAVAAMRSVTDGKALHSLHSYFLRPAEVGAQVRHEVELLRDGRSYSSRAVRAYQNGTVVYTCSASFAAKDGGASFAASAPERVPAPESLPSSAEHLREHGAGLPPRVAEYWSRGRSFDMRHAPDPVYIETGGGRCAHQAVWLKPFDALRETEGLAEADRDRAALAYVCDYTILEAVLRAVGLSWSSQGLATASLDHAMWFHRPVRMDDWVLYAQEAVAAESGRGVGLGRFFSRAGTHLATVAQEGMIRCGEQR